MWKASLLGVPLPLCSCGVIPVAASMRRHGASRAAVTAFLLSTPQTGVDSIAATYALLGPVFAAFRPDRRLGQRHARRRAGAAAGRVEAERRAEEADRPPAPSRAAAASAPARPAPRLGYGLVTLPRDVAVVAAPGRPASPAPWPCWRRNDQLHAYLGGGIVSILLLMAAGVPVYVCATASVPIAAGFIHMGASPGAALAFLIPGAATNPATFTTVWKVLGRRSRCSTCLSVAVGAVGCGLLLDRLFSLLGMAAAQLAADVHSMTHGMGWSGQPCGPSPCWPCWRSRISRPRDARPGAPATRNMNTRHASHDGPSPRPRCYQRASDENILLTAATNIDWVGSVDSEVRDFHGYDALAAAPTTPTWSATSQTALIDAVRAPMPSSSWPPWPRRCDPAQVAYVVCNHAEPDHSGACRG